MKREIAVVGAGWAGLAAAVEATTAGARVTLFEMAPQAGGRARSVAADMVAASEVADPPTRLDNGQHICIGAYTETLRLLRQVGVSEHHAFVRMPLMLVDSRGFGLRLRAGPPLPAFVLAVLRRRGWHWRDRLALLRRASQWSRDGFRCDASATVAQLCRGLSVAVQRDFIEPLCVAALNTPMTQASGSIFLRVLHDALTSGPGSADLLLPRLDLGAVFPEPALAWLRGEGAAVRLVARVERIEHVAGTAGGAWAVGGARFDGVVVAASAVEAARLVAAHAPHWAAQAAALRYQPIVTVYARSAGCRLPEPMLALAAGAESPAQFVIDRGQLGGEEGLLALVASGAAHWVERGADVTAGAALEQARIALGAHLRGPLELVRTIVEKRATFACTPGLERPPAQIVPGFFAAGDYVEGPYPATLEGAVRSGIAAARATLAGLRSENSA